MSVLMYHYWNGTLKQSVFAGMTLKQMLTKYFGFINASLKLWYATSRDQQIGSETLNKIVGNHLQSKCVHICPLSQSNTRLPEHCPKPLLHYWLERTFHSSFKGLEDLNTHTNLLKSSVIETVFILSLSALKRVAQDNCQLSTWLDVPQAWPLLPLFCGPYMQWRSAITSWARMLSEALLTCFNVPVHQTPTAHMYRPKELWKQSAQFQTS